MPVSLQCPNSYTGADGKPKKCGETQPYIDPKTDKVYCSTCNAEMLGVSHFTKVTLKTLKQYKTRSTATFKVTCKSCNSEAQLQIVNNKVICPQCKKEHLHLTEPFKLMIKQYVGKANKDVS